jgi:hypothetical protein
MRTFEDAPAIRQQTHAMLGLCGPSGSGKTFSALRMATGIQSVCGGEIFFIDTENDRALHYADRFKFRHVPFRAPFRSVDYLAAIEHCAGKGAGVIIIDSMSHEHDGEGGVLEQHDDAVDRMAKGDSARAKRVDQIAWGSAKKGRKILLNALSTRIGCHIIMCFRAKEKLKIESGKEPTHLGYMPIGGEEIIFELTAKMLLLPGADGVPTWISDYIGEKAIMKLPIAFREMPCFRPGQVLSEETGQMVARWAKGDDVATPGVISVPLTASQTSGKVVVVDTKPPLRSTDLAVQPFLDLLAGYTKCSTKAEFDALEKQRAAIWKDCDKARQKRLKEVSLLADERCKAVESEVLDATQVSLILDRAEHLGCKDELVAEFGPISIIKATSFQAVADWLTERSAEIENEAEAY